jgi:hypothetical protein
VGWGETGGRQGDRLQEMVLVPDSFVCLILVDSCFLDLCWIRVSVLEVVGGCDVRLFFWRVAHIGIMVLFCDVQGS